MGKKEEEEKEDLTALEDIGQYLHQLNPDVEKKLEHGKKETGVHGEPTKPEEPQSSLPSTPEGEIPAEQFATEEQPPSQAEFKPEPSEEFKTEEPTPPEEPPLGQESPPSEETVFPSEEPAPPFEEVAPPTPTEEIPVPEENIQPESPPSEMEAKEEEPKEPPPEKPKTPDKFAEVKEFGKNISTSTAATPGNPPFSIVIKNIKFSEDANDILAALMEYGIAKATNEKIFKDGLDSGSLLISQLAESTAILLVHKFRQYDIEIEMGLSEEIRPSKTRGKKGLVSRRNLEQNKSETFDLTISSEEPKEIPITTTPSLENHIINRYIGIVSEHSLVPESEIEKTEWEEKYFFLANQLKSKAIKLRGNAIVGISFQLSPIEPSQYKLTCTGNVVWVTPSKENTL